MIYKAQHWKLQNEQCKTTGVNSGAPEGYIIPDSLVAPVVLLLLQTGDKSMHNGNNEIQRNLQVNEFQSSWDIYKYIIKMNVDI